MPIKTGTLVTTDGIQKLWSRSAVTPATSAATTDIAVAIVGFTAFTGRLPWGMAISVAVGIVLIFGSAQIVQSLSSGAGN